MSTPRNLMPVVKSLFVIALLLPQIGCEPDPDPPGISSISPNPLTRGQQNVQVTLTGEGFIPGNGRPPTVVVDEGNNDGITGALVSYDDTHIVLNLSVSNAAVLGQHQVSVYTHPFVRDITNLTVQCNPPNSCSPSPTLESITPVDAKQGGTRVIQFTGTNFHGNSPTVEIADGGVTIPNGTVITVAQSSNGLNSFRVPVVVDPFAHTGYHRMRVITNSGRTQWGAIQVDSTESDPDLPPRVIPTLQSVTPLVIGKETLVLIECHGSGFGTNRKVWFTRVGGNGTDKQGAYPVASAEADPDSVAVAGFPPSEAGTVKVQVETEDGLITDDIRISVVGPAQGAPVLNGSGTYSSGTHSPCDLRPGGPTCTLYVDGDNLSTVSDLSWPLIPGLTFSHTNFPSEFHGSRVEVDITADSAAPLTGNEATNLTITNTTGTSLPFFVPISR